MEQRKTIPWSTEQTVKDFENAYQEKLEKERELYEGNDWDLEVLMWEE